MVDDFENVGTVSCMYLRTIVAGCIGCGIKPDILYNSLDGGKAGLENSSLRYAGHNMMSMLNNAVTSTQDQSIALRVGLGLRPDSLEDVAYAVTFCDNLKDVMAMISRYQVINQGYGSTHLEVLPDVARIIWTPRYENVEMFRYFVDLVFAGYATVGKWLLFQKENPIDAVEFRHSPPDDTSVYENVFGPNITFNAPQDRMTFSPELARVPLPARNPRVKKLMCERLEERLKNLGVEKTVAEQVHQCIVSELSGGRPEISRIARILGFSERTLRRKLSEEGTTFREVMDGASKEVCEIFLRKFDYNHAQIAQSMGFSDQSSYSRAFKRWYGCTPKSYRAAILS